MPSIPHRPLAVPLLVMLAAIAAAADPVDPLTLEFHRLACRRFILSNNLPLNALVPTEIVAVESMHPLMLPGADGPQPVKAKPELVDGRLVLAAATVGTDPTLWVGGVNPYATCEIDVQAVTPAVAGAGPVEVAVDIATLGLGTRVQVVARHGAADKGVVLRLVKDGAVVREDVFADKAPEPPYLLQVQLSGRSLAAFATRNGRTDYLGHTPPKAHFRDHADFRDRALAARSSFNVAAHLPAGASLTIGGARSYLSAGVGQADIRMITHRDGSPFIEDHRLWFTFSCRGLNIEDSLQGVMSLDPSLFDPRLEGAIVFDHGDGKLRNDYASHVFYDDEAKEWRAWSCDFGGVAGREERGGSGLVLGRSASDPRRGFCVLQARAMPPISPEHHEDPCGFYDAELKKWRIITSSFHKGIKASLFEADSWDGPMTRIAGPVEYDSTGTLIQKIGDQRYIFSGSSKGPMMVYSYPGLKYLGDLKIDLPAHWPKGPGRGWPNVFPLPAGFPCRYMALMMDRPNFPNVKGGNWSYGALYLFGAHTAGITDPAWEFAPAR